MVIQALIPESTIKALDIGILRGLARLDEGEFHTPGMCLFIQCQAGKFRNQRRIGILQVGISGLRDYDTDWLNATT